MEPGVVLFSRFTVRKKLGAGSFGEIYEAEDTVSGQNVALKLESVRAKSPQLEFESRIYQIFEGGIAIPKVYFYGTNQKFHCLAMQLLGKSLEDIFLEYKAPFSLKTVLMLADQMINAVEFLHKRHFIHRDIKPDNFLIGTGNESNQVFVIDFGLSKKYRDPSTWQHIPWAEGKSLTGTARYASVNAMKGHEQGRRDDMESLCYVWLYFLKGKLPWQGLPAPDQKSKMKRILEVKARTSIEDLCKDVPEEFATYLKAVKGLMFQEEPKYSEYREMFRQLFLKEGYVYDFKYDWLEKAKPFKVQPPAPKDEKRAPRAPLPLVKICEQKAPMLRRVGLSDMNVRLKKRPMPDIVTPSARTEVRMRTAFTSARLASNGALIPNQFKRLRVDQPLISGKRPVRASLFPR